MTICFDHVSFGPSGGISMHRLLAAFFAVFVVFAGPVLAQPSRYLISAQPMTDTPPGVQAWRIQYWTTNGNGQRSEEHTSELQSLMRSSYADFCLNKKNNQTTN